ncbi:MAG: hypothetical protein LBI01_02950 [Elusimicrobium sp.]|jgi:hypothetical protein|nr:hypothetical protein [Elusimicrobium sp.]
MKKQVIIAVVLLLVIFGLFWAWSHYSMGRSTTIGTLTAPAPARNTQPAAGANY